MQTFLHFVPWLFGTPGPLPAIGLPTCPVHNLQCEVRHGVIRVRGQSVVRQEIWLEGRYRRRGSLTALVTQRVLEVIWKALRGSTPPKVAADRRSSWADALSWAVATGVGVGVPRLLAMRSAAALWEAAVHEPPPESGWTIPQRRSDPQRVGTLALALVVSARGASQRQRSLTGFVSDGAGRKLDNERHISAALQCRWLGYVPGRLLLDAERQWLGR